MGKSFTNLDQSKLDAMRGLQRKWEGQAQSEKNGQTEEEKENHDGWRAAVIRKEREGDVEGMRREALPYAQREAIELALGADSDQIRLQAIQFLMGQEGHGVVQKVQHSVQYEQMSPQQIIAVISSKLSRMSSLVPGFSPEKLLAEVRAREREENGRDETIADAEYVEVKP